MIGTTHVELALQSMTFYRDFVARVFFNQKLQTTLSLLIL
jgi:hypothetical protein